MDDYLLQEYEQSPGCDEYSLHPEFLQKSPQLGHPILGIRSPLPFEPLEEMYPSRQSDFQNLGIDQNQASLPGLDRVSSLEFTNNQVSMAQFHSNQLYRLNENAQAPDFIYHPSLPYGIATADNVNRERSNAQLIEDHRNGILHSGVDFYEIQYDEEPRTFFKPEIPEFEDAPRVAEEIFGEEEKDVKEEESLKVKLELEEASKSAVKNLEISAEEFQKVEKRTRKTRTSESSGGDSSYSEGVKSSERRKYTLTKNTKVFDMEKDLASLKDPRLTKAEKQKIRNRISAQKSRDRKKEESGNLKVAINELLGENETLRKQLKKRERQMKKLRKLMEAKLCAKCKKIQFDVSCESTDDDEEDTAEISLTNDNSQSSGHSSPRGFTLMRRNAGSALTGGLFAAFIGLICMLGIYMNNQGTYDPGMMSLKQKYDTPSIDVVNAKVQEFQTLNQAAMVQELQKYQQQLESLIRPEQEVPLEVENKAIMQARIIFREAQKVKFQNEILEKVINTQKMQKPQKAKGFLLNEPSTEQNIFKTELDCVNQKIQEQTKSEQSSLARIGSGYLRRERELIDPSVNSVYCSKSIVSPSTITLNEQESLSLRDGCNFIHLMIPSSEVSLSPGSLPITMEGENDGSYLLQIGCKVFQVNKIMMSNTDINF